MKNLYKAKKLEKYLINKILQIKLSEMINIYKFINEHYIYGANTIATKQ